MQDSYVFNWGQKIGDVWFVTAPTAVRLGHIAWCTSVFAKAKEESCTAVEIACGSEKLMDKIISITRAEYSSTIYDSLSEERQRFFVVRKALSVEKTKQQIADAYSRMPKASDPIHRVSRLELPQYNRQRDLEW